MQEWYSTLLKPSWAPPSFLFGPVWTVLYILIAVSFTTVFVKIAQGAIPKYVAIPFVLNIIFNLAFTPLQFGLRSNILAGIDILLVLGTLLWALMAIYPYIKWVSYINIPYFFWVLFATTLQMTIIVLNW